VPSTPLYFACARVRARESGWRDRAPVDPDRVVEDVSIRVGILAVAVPVVPCAAFFARSGSSALACSELLTPVANDHG